jgi:hypothetical protein
LLKENELILALAEEVRLGNNGNNDWNSVSKLLGLRYGIVKTPNACKKMFQRSIKNIENGDKLAISKEDYVRYEMTGEGLQSSERMIALSQEDLKNHRNLMLAHGFNADEFELLGATNNFWGNGLYQSKIKVKPKVSDELTKEDIVCLVREYAKPREFEFKLNKIVGEEGYALEVAFADVHIGSLSWHGEVGEDNDYKIAFAKIINNIQEIRSIMEIYPIEKLYICFLGDFLHIDTMDSTTTRGTRVDTDTRPKKIVNKSMEIVMFMIENLAICDTEVIWIEGNHSRLVEYTIFQALPFIYKNYSHIKFDVRPIQRKAFFYKGNLIGLHHGEMKKDQLFNWIQVEQRELWGKANYVEQHSGHEHQERVTAEKGGIIQRTNPTSKVQDLYEFENGWKSYKATIAYLWSEKDNLKAQFYLR